MQYLNQPFFCLLNLCPQCSPKMFLFPQALPVLCDNFKSSEQWIYKLQNWSSTNPQKYPQLISAMSGHCTPWCPGALTKTIQLTQFCQSPQTVTSISPTNSWVSVWLPRVHLMPASSKETRKSPGVRYNFNKVL